MGSFSKDQVVAGVGGAIEGAQQAIKDGMPDTIDLSDGSGDAKHLERMGIDVDELRNRLEAEAATSMTAAAPAAAKTAEAPPKA